MRLSTKRGLKINDSLSADMGDILLGKESQHSPLCSPYSREEECPGRQFVQGSVSHLTERMEFESVYCKTHISGI